MNFESEQIAIFLAITSLIGWLTWRKCVVMTAQQTKEIESDQEIFLAGKSLPWVFVAGSITLTNLSTDQLVGMNGNQMALLVWWELSAVIGLIILARLILPVYYRLDCRTTTELLEKRYQNPHIRALISFLFLMGNVFILMPSLLYGGSLFIKTLFQIDLPLIGIALFFASLGSAYALLGGLRAVAVSDSYSSLLLLTLGTLLVLLSLAAINFDFTGIPEERLTLIGSNDSPIPWHTLLTGMLFIQIFYWGTNQTITQRAMASPNVKEAQRGVLVAAAVRLLIVPPMVVIPGIVSFKLFGDVGDQAFGMVAGYILPPWLSGAFAAAIAAAVLTSVNSVLNSSTTLYVFDIHRKYFTNGTNIKSLNKSMTIIFITLAMAMVPMYSKAESIINLVQQLYGLLSMPILSAFLVALLFKNVNANAMMLAVVSGVMLYAYFSLVWSPMHYIHMMFVTVIISFVISLFLSSAFWRTRPVWDPLILQGPG